MAMLSCLRERFVALSILFWSSLIIKRLFNLLQRTRVGFGRDDNHFGFTFVMAPGAWLEASPWKPLLSWWGCLELGLCEQSQKPYGGS